VFKHKPIIIGESDPEGCAACKGPANAYRNGTMYSSYTAASFPRLQALAKRRDLNLEGVLTWAFEFEDQPYFAGFRQLTSNGIDMPVMNVFKLFAKMGGSYVADVSDHQTPLDDRDEGWRPGRSGCRQRRDAGRQDAVGAVWHYHDDDLPGPDADVRIDVRGICPPPSPRARS
jgi:xylan 1,4-beta-xylosidase